MGEEVLFQRRGLFIASATILIAVLAGHSGQAFSQKRTGAGGSVTVTVREGENWFSYLRIMGIFKKAKPPQMALWLEEPDGTFVAILYVTGRTAVQDWRTMPFDKKDRIRRPSALPVWTFRHIRGGIQPIESCSACHDRHRSADKSIEGNPYLDTLTSATPESDFSRNWTVPDGLKSGTYIMCAEINHSFDYNDMYPKDLPPDDPRANDVNGQPSLIYAAPLFIGDHADKTVLEPVGHGHPAGKDGAVSGKLDGITTAGSIVRAIEIDYTP